MLFRSDKVPDDYIRRQTLTNAERYIIPELKEYEDTVLNAEAEIIQLEVQLFTEVVEKIRERSREIQSLARDVAVLDILAGFADAANEYSYVRPQLVDTDEITLIEGRHPVVERMHGTRFVPNGIDLSSDETRMMMLTGAKIGRAHV